MNIADHHLRPARANLAIWCDADGGDAGAAVGLGGIWVEIMKDSALRVLPATREQIRAAFEELRAAPLLHGARGAAAVDLDGDLDRGTCMQRAIQRILAREAMNFGLDRDDEIIERLGKYHRTLEGGIHILVPFVVLAVGNALAKIDEETIPPAYREMIWDHMQRVAAMMINKAP